MDHMDNVLPLRFYALKFPGKRRAFLLFDFSIKLDILPHNFLLLCKDKTGPVYHRLNCTWFIEDLKLRKLVFDRADGQYNMEQLAQVLPDRYALADLVKLIKEKQDSLYDWSSLIPPKDIRKTELGVE